MAKVYLIIFSFFFYLGTLFSQNESIKFEHLTTDNGLSSNTVKCIFQDSQGFMWFGTEDGLNKYNGYEFQTYFFEPGDSNSLVNNYIRSIQEDLNGNLWIGTTGGGLNKLDRKTTWSWG